MAVRKYQLPPLIARQHNSLPYFDPYPYTLKYQITVATTPSSEKLLFPANGAHPRKSKLDTGQRSTDNWEPDPNWYIYRTAPASMAQGTLQERGRRMTLRVGILKNLLWNSLYYLLDYLLLRKDQNNGNVNMKERQLQRTKGDYWLLGKGKLASSCDESLIDCLMPSCQPENHTHKTTKMNSTGCIFIYL